MKKASALPRCKWPGSDPLYLAYHDREWGVPLRDSRALFEMLQLEGAQAGLSWITILRKRENYRRAFDGFDPVKIARYTPAKIEKLMGDEGIVRNRLKIEGVVVSAKAYLAMEKEGLDFSEFLWGFVDAKPILNHLKPGEPIPAETEISRELSKALKKRGFKFVGSTIVYAFMQAVGMVNDHLVTCYRHPEFKKRAKR
jgi:DNA-3-methyladenine glycosylase I